MCFAQPSMARGDQLFYPRVKLSRYTYKWHLLELLSHGSSRCTDCVLTLLPEEVWSVGDCDTLCASALCNFMWSATLWLSCCGFYLLPRCNNTTYSLLWNIKEGRNFTNGLPSYYNPTVSELFRMSHYFTSVCKDRLAECFIYTPGFTNNTSGPTLSCACASSSSSV